MIRFKTEEVVLTHHEAWTILVFFFGGSASTLPGWLTDEDRAFAQALLVEAVEASARIGVIQRLWESTVTPPTTIKGALLKLAKFCGKVLIDRLKSAKVENFSDAKIYRMVKDSITRNHRSGWRIRIETGEPVLY